MDLFRPVGHAFSVVLAALLLADFDSPEASAQQPPPRPIFNFSYDTPHPRSSTAAQPHAMVRPSVLERGPNAIPNLRTSGYSPGTVDRIRRLPPVHETVSLSSVRASPSATSWQSNASDDALHAAPSVDADQFMYLAPFRQRADTYPEREWYQLPKGTAEALPPGYQPWWNRQLADPMRAGSNPLSVGVHSLVVGALAHSPDVLAVYADVSGRQTAIAKAYGDFDWRAFAESTYDHTSDPVGSALTTGGPPRFRDRDWHFSSGVRKQTGLGGEFEIAQEMGRQHNNSRFFIPEDQGQTRLEISFTQPLLNKAGRFYNESQIVIAQIDTEVAGCELREKLEDHSLKVAQAYWDVYRARAIRWQKQKLFDSASLILGMLRAREAVDAVRQQVLRAEAAVANRRSEIMRAEAEVRNAESRLRLLVNDARLTNGGQIELIPLEMPAAHYVEVSMRGSLETALSYRPDVAKAIREVNAAGVRLGVAQKELLPKLDLVLSTYMAGLEGDAKVGTAFGNQFSEGEPGYSLGLLFEVPLGNRSARAAVDSRHAELRKAMYALQLTVDTGMTEVELAVREVETSYHESVAKYQAMIAAEAEAKYLDRRWRLVPGHDAATPRLLEDLLDAQERLAEAELGFVAAQVNYTLSLIELKRATGTLMQVIDGGPGENVWSDAGSAMANAPIRPNTGLPAPRSR